MQGGFHIWTLYRIVGNQTEQRVKARRYIDRLGAMAAASARPHRRGQRARPRRVTVELLTPIPSFVCPDAAGRERADAKLELKVR